MKQKIIFLVLILALFLVGCVVQHPQEVKGVNREPVIKNETLPPEAPLPAEEKEEIIEVESAKEEVKEATKVSDLQKALEESKKSLEDYKSKTSKLDECTKLCAGEEYNIPYVKDQWYSTCYQLYYYAGESSLDEQIADCTK